MYTSQASIRYATEANTVKYVKYSWNGMEYSVHAVDIDQGWGFKFKAKLRVQQQKEEQIQETKNKNDNLILPINSSC